MAQRTRLKYTDEVKAEIWDRWQKGETRNAIGRALDRHSNSIFDVSTDWWHPSTHLAALKISAYTL